MLTDVQVLTFTSMSFTHQITITAEVVAIQLLRRWLHRSPARTCHQLNQGSERTIVISDNGLQLLLLIPADHLFSVGNHISDPNTLQPDKGFVVDNSVLVPVGVGQSLHEVCPFCRGDKEGTDIC
jgi:hypothetical protein